MILAPDLAPSQIGFLYLRYVGSPRTLWDWVQPYVRDSEVSRARPARSVAFQLLQKRATGRHEFCGLALHGPNAGQSLLFKNLNGRLCVCGKHPLRLCPSPGAVRQDLAPSPEGKNVSMGAFVRDVFLEQVAPCWRIWFPPCPQAPCRMRPVLPLARLALLFCGRVRNGVGT